MKQLTLLALALFFTMAVSAQEKEDNGWTKVYRGTTPMINDLVHTKVDVKFDYDKSYSVW